MPNEITRRRTEIKYRLDTKHVHTLRKALHANIDPHSFKKGKVLTLMSSVYFDTPDFRYYRTAAEDPRHNTKIRTREYYYFNRELIEHASSFDSLFEYSDAIWLEIKHRDGDTTEKTRMKIRKDLLNSGKGLSGLLPILRTDNPNLADLEQFSNIIRDLSSGALRPAAVVNYKRNAFQTPDESLRISIDTAITFHKAPDSVFSHSAPLTKETLPPPLGKETMNILEIKCLGEHPDWLSRALEGLAPVVFSKFLQCLGSVCSLREDVSV